VRKEDHSTHQPPFPALTAAKLYCDLLKLYVDLLKLYCDLLKLYGYLLKLYGDLLKFYGNLLKLYGNLLKLYGNLLKLYCNLLKVCDGVATVVKSWTFINVNHCFFGQVSVHVRTYTSSECLKKKTFLSPGHCTQVINIK
jgi:hypothetical protein